MRILVLNGSPHPEGNTRRMIEAFREGAMYSGHQVGVVDVFRKKVGDCMACEYCHTKGNGKCIQKDGMREIYELLKEAEMLVIASPVYFHGISGQLKCVIDRLYSVTYPVKLSKLKKAAMILSSRDNYVYDSVVLFFKRNFLDYLGLENMGVLTAYGSTNVSDAKLEELRAFGASLKSI